MIINLIIIGQMFWDTIHLAKLVSFPCCVQYNCIVLLCSEHLYRTSRTDTGHQLYSHTGLMLTSLCATFRRKIIKPIIAYFHFHELFSKTRKKLIFRHLLFLGMKIRTVCLKLARKQRRNVYSFVEKNNKTSGQWKNIKATYVEGI